MNRWNDLSEDERELIRLLITKRVKMYALASRFNRSETWVKRKFDAIYRVLDVEDCIDLALWVGRNYDLVAAEPKLRAVAR